MSSWLYATFMQGKKSGVGVKEWDREGGQMQVIHKGFW